MLEKVETTASVCYTMSKLYLVHRNDKICIKAMPLCSCIQLLHPAHRLVPKMVLTLCNIPIYTTHTHTLYIYIPNMHKFMHSVSCMTFHRPNTLLACYAGHHPLQCALVHMVYTIYKHQGVHRMAIQHYDQRTS